MEKIPTASDMLIDKGCDLFANGPVHSESGFTVGTCEQLMIEFAKLHVEAALKAVVELSEKEDLAYTDDETILSVYPPDLIK
jgi:hypothetical protein